MIMTVGPGNIDLHMHTCVSDGTDTPEQILEKVRDKKLRVFSVTDHDAFKAAFSIFPLLRKGDPFFIPGAEFSCRDEEGKYHILGYGFDPEGKSIRDVVDLGHSYRMKKVRARLDFLSSEFGFSFPDEEIEALMALNNPGKPHIGNLMVKLGYAVSKEEAIEEYIDRLRFKSEYVRPEQAIEGILRSGGIAILAHPSYGDGDDLILGEEMDERLRRLMEYGIQGVEAYYSGFTPKIQNEVLGFAEKYDLYVTAGSDYHGGNKMVDLGWTNLDDISEAPAGLKRFLDDVEIIQI